MNDKIERIKIKNNEDNPIKCIKFFLFLTPEPYSRPRYSSKSNVFYNPRDKYKRKLKTLIKEKLLEMNYNIGEPSGPVKLFLMFGIKPPKNISESKIKNELSIIHNEDLDIKHFNPDSISNKILNPVITRPDIDNYIKPVQDVMNKFMYSDDSQIYSVTGEKYYSEKEFIYVEMRYRNDKIKFR